MENFLLWLGANAIKGAVVTLIIFLMLLLFSRKIPARYKYKLWYLAAIRFIMLPVFFTSFSFFTFTSSLMPEELPLRKELSIEQETGFDAKHEANAYPALSVSNYSKPEKSWTALIKENTSAILFAVWGLGAFGLILLFILRNIWGHSLTKGLEPVKDKKINAFIDECRKLVKVNRKFTLYETELTGSPVLLGVFKPKLLVPGNLFNKLKVQEVRYVILHELMHLKKNDILINWLFGIVCAFQWFNPFTWYVFARMKSDREEARDADVLALLNKNESKKYGGLILKLSTLCSPGASFSESVGIMEKNKKIKKRIMMIKNFRIMSFWNTLLAVVIIAGVGISCLSEAQSNKAEMLDKFESIKIKQVDFIMIDNKSVVERLHSIFLQHYPESKVKFILDMDKKEQLKLNRHYGGAFRGGSFEFVLDSVCEMFSLQYRIEKNAVVFSAANIESLTRALNDKDSKVRGNAAKTLGRLDDKRAFELLLKALKDKDRFVRRDAAIALGHLKDERALVPLTNALKDENKNVRRQAANALGSLKDKRAVEPLSKLLKDKDKHVRVEAASSLEIMDDKRGFEFLINALKDEDSYARRYAADVLGNLKDKRAVEPLNKLLGDEDSSVRISVARALSELGDKRAFGPLIKALNDKREDIRVTAASALGRLKDKRAVEPLINALKDKDSDVRSHAASALGSLKDKRALVPLINVLNDQDSFVRVYAAYALGRLGDKRAADPLIKALNDKDSDVRRAAVFALGALGDKRTFELLIKVLKDKNSDMRINAVSALGELGDKRAFERLIKALEDKDSDMRIYAADALGRLGDKRAVEPLIKALKDKDSLMRINAASALGKLGDNRAADPLFNALKDKDSSVRYFVVYALGKLGNIRAVKPLKELLKVEKDSREIQEIKKVLKQLNNTYSTLTKPAVASANSWLALIDNGKYKKSWNEAAEYFKAAVSKERWEQAIQSVRKPLGKNLSRKLISKKYYTSLPGAPDGKYIVIRFKSSFRNKKSAIETITPMLGKDGKWRVSGYFIK